MKIIAPQYSISIDGRDLSRGRALREGVRQPQASVRIASCGQCGVQVGQCSCSGGTSFSTAPPSNFIPSGTIGADGINPPTCDPGCYPRGACGPDGRFVYTGYAQQLRQSRMRQCPHEDPQYDDMHMDTLLSAVTTVAAGASVDIPVSPAAGTFAAFYWSIVAVDPLTQVEQVDWRAGQPRVEGCPVPCGNGTTEALAQFVMKVPEACCGHTIVAWLDRASEDTPLVVPFTNNQAAGDLLVQVELRGYCCSTRIC